MILPADKATADKPGAAPRLDAAHLAERTLIRRFQAVTGTTPIKWLTEQRVLRARELLESSALGVEQVARECGLGAAANFRRHFALAVGVSPSAYRRAFATKR